jgi:hypothetical protein
MLGIEQQLNRILGMSEDDKMMSLDDRVGRRLGTSYCLIILSRSFQCFRQYLLAGLKMSCRSLSPHGETVGGLE